MLESNPPSNTRLETQRDDERSGRDILPLPSTTTVSIDFLMSQKTQTADF